MTADTSAPPERLCDLDRPRSARALDRVRLLEFTRRRERGEEPLAAWVAIVTDATLGTRDHRGKLAVPTSVAARSLTRFLERTAPQALDEARHAIGVEAARVSSRAVHVLEQLMDGKFECESQRANVQLAAARAILAIVGATGRAGAGTSHGPTVAVQVNTTPHDIARVLTADPEAHAAAIEAARRANAPAAPADPDAESDV